MRKGIFILTCSLILILLSCKRNETASFPLRPNILLVITDDRPEFSLHWELAFGKVPGEELYHKAEDPDMLDNLAQDPAHTTVNAGLREKLDRYLVETSDPGSRGLSPWDVYYLDKPVPPK